MRNFSKNKKGFTIAEEIISLLLVSILIVTASGILTSQMRIFSRNIITVTAQQKGIALMEQLVDDLEYAKIISDTELTDTSYPYHVAVYLESNSGDSYLKKDVDIKYSSSGSYNSATNTVCNLGSYTASYELTYDDTNETIVVDLAVQKSGTTYYSEKRTVALKNSPTVSFASSLSADCSTSKSNMLYIAGLE